MKDHIGIDYQIAGIEILLNEDCIVQRFYPLIQYKDRLSANLSEKGILTRNACAALSDQELIEAGLPDENMAALFRCFLHLYDYKGKGIKDIPGCRMQECKRDIVSAGTDAFAGCESCQGAAVFALRDQIAVRSG